MIFLSANPYDKAHELARAITDSEQYRNYVQTKEVVESNPELKEKILTLRNKQMELNRAQMLGEDIGEDFVAKITREFAELNQIKELADFFNAEGHFITLFNDIQGIIQSKIEEGFE